MPPTSRIGQKLQNEYLIKGILGEGELGVTYEAENARLKSKFAVLMLRREVKPTFETLLAMRNDLRRAEQLSQVGLMPAKQVTDANQIPGIATELLEGETLRARLLRGPMRVERAVALCLSVARTLEAVHKAGMVHGDLRPENIFLVKPGAKSRFAGKVVVVEHSLHHLRRRPPGFDDSLPIYKLVYRPIEQIMGESGASALGDVFVLGAILYECLTGRPAFFGEEREYVYEKLGSPPPSLKPNPAIGLDETLAAALSVLCANACQRDLAERTASMTEFIEDLEAVVQSRQLQLPEVIAEVPQAVPQAAPAPGRMNRVLQRLSGIFPQISLPPAQSDPKLPALSLPPTSSPPTSSPPASVSGADISAQLQPITAPKKRVSQVLRRLSGAFAAIQPMPPEGEEAPAKPIEVKLPVGKPINIKPPESAAAGAKPAAATNQLPPALAGLMGSSAPGADARRALELIQKLSRPADASAPSSPRPPSPAPGGEEPLRPTFPPIVPLDKSPPPAEAKAAPVESKADSKPEAKPVASAPEASEAAVSKSSEPAAVQAPPAEPAAPSPRPAPESGQPAPAAAAPVVAAGAAPMPVETPAVLSAPAVDAGGDVPPTVPPREVSFSSAETPRAAARPPTPVAGTEHASPPQRSLIALDSTLQPSDLAELAEPDRPAPVPPAAPAVPVPQQAAQSDKPASPADERPEPAKMSASPQLAAPLPGDAPTPAPGTLPGSPLTSPAPSAPAAEPIASVPTRPVFEALAALGDLSPLESRPIAEQATQPALRRLPITEAATQAKLDVSSLAALLASEQPTPAGGLPPLTQAPTQVKDRPQPPAPPPEAHKPPTRARRASQLLEVLKQAPPPIPVEARMSTPASGTGAIPEAQSPLGTGGVARLPGRMSPGLVPPAPAAPPGQLAPWETSSQPAVAPRSNPAPLPPPTLKSFLLQHQEAAAALVGALLVLLLSVLFLILK